MTVLLVVAVIAALACPAHMLWARRGGRWPACCPGPARPDVDALVERQRELAVRVAAMSRDGDRPPAARG